MAGVPFFRRICVGNLVSMIFLVLLLLQSTAVEPSTVKSTTVELSTVKSTTGGSTTIESTSIGSISIKSTSIEPTTVESSDESTTLAAVETTTATEVQLCDKLNENSTKHDFMNCEKKTIRLKTINGKNIYPTVDFSDFSQEEFEKAMTPKKQNNEGPFINETMKGRQFCGNFLAKGSHLSAISVGFQVEDVNIPQSFVLIDNWNLENVTIETPTVKEIGDQRIAMIFTIRNNKRLSSESIAHLNAVEYKHKDSYIQEEGECSLNQERLDSLEDLEYCQYTVDDLVIDKETDIGYNNTLTLREVRGCIKIKNTKLENLNVLRTIESINCTDHHEIVNNEKLCLHPEEVFDLRNKLNATLVYKDNSNCSGECTSTYFMKEKDATCVIITNTLNVSGMPGDVDLTHFKNVEEIWGRLIMESNELTDLSPGVLFPKLKLINGTRDNSGPVVDVRFNTKLVTFKIAPNIKVVRKTHNVLRLHENGNFTISEEDKKELTKKFGNGTVAADHGEDPPVHVINVASNSSSKESGNDKKEKKEESYAVEIGVSVSLGALVIIAILVAFIIYVIFVAVKVAKRRKEMLNTLRIYDSTAMTNLNIKPVDMVVYPYENTKTWINAAAQIIKENVPKIHAQHEDRLKRKKNENEKHLFVQKNSRPVHPIFSRFDSVHQNFSSEYIGNYRTPNPKYGQNDEEPEFKKKCLDGCMHRVKDGHSSPVCQKKCNCKDIGIKVNSKFVFGVRMQQVPPSKWNKNELERNHFFAFKLMDPPITYEETSGATMSWMEKEPMDLIKNEISFQEEISKPVFTSINGTVGKVDKTMKDKEMKEKMEKEKKEKEKKKDKDQQKVVVKTSSNSAYRYTMMVYTYAEEGNQLEDITNFNITPKPPNVCSAFRQGLCPCRNKNTTHAIDNHDDFLENMINAHMNCPLGKWVTNYDADDIIKLCQLMINMGGKAFVKEQKVNVRIIGDIRGKFDDLRKSLCLPSVNAPNSHPLIETSHIFLGNYAGPFGQSMEVICLLFALKCRYNTKYTLLRGALEWKAMGDVSGLKVEIFTRFPGRGGEVYEKINDAFNTLPLVCKLGKNILCTHAGIAPKMEEIENYTMPITDLIPDSLPFNLVFAQPNWTVKRFFDNVDQKAGYYFGYEAMKTALDAFSCQALFCSKPLKSGYGIIGTAYRLYSVCGHQATPDHFIAQAEYDFEGGLTIQILHIPQQDAVVYNDQKAYVFTEEDNIRINSYMKFLDFIPDNDKSTLSVVKTQCESVVNAPAAQDDQ